MVKAPKGFRHRTRKLLRKHIREKGGVPPLSLLMYKYKPGDKVYIIINPSIVKGMPHRRYHGKVGVVLGKRGRAYEVAVKVGSKLKKLFVRPEHLRPTPETKARIESEIKSEIENLLSMRKS